MEPGAHEKETASAVGAGTATSPSVGPTGSGKVKEWLDNIDVVELGAGKS